MNYAYLHRLFIYIRNHPLSGVFQIAQRHGNPLTQRHTGAMTNKEKREHVRTLWDLVQEELGMKFWREPMANHVSFGFDRAKRRIGYAKYHFYRWKMVKGDPSTFNTLRVQYSKHFAAKLVGSDKEHFIEDTLRHEAAHIFNFVENGNRHGGHGALWKRWAVRCGADPSRTKDIPDELSPPYKWIMVCPSCDNTYGFYRKPRKVRSCGKCYPAAFNPDYEMLLKKA